MFSLEIDRLSALAQRHHSLGWFFSSSLWFPLEQLGRSRAMEAELQRNIYKGSCVTVGSSVLMIRRYLIQISFLASNLFSCYWPIGSPLGKKCNPTVSEAYLTLFPDDRSLRLSALLLNVSSRNQPLLCRNYWACSSTQNIRCPNVGLWGWIDDENNAAWNEETLANRSCFHDAPRQ